MLTSALNPHTHTQVGSHYLKDLFDTFFMQPVTNMVQDQVLEAAGMSGVASSLGQATNSAVYRMQQGQSAYNQFQHMR